MKPGALEAIAAPAPGFGENLCPARVELHADIWGTTDDGEQLPRSTSAPGCLFRSSDRSQHFHNRIEAEIERLETRVQELKMQLTRTT
jgi:hypothetical protein